MTSLDDFNSWLAKAPAKSVFCYYTGEKGTAWLEQRVPNCSSVALVPDEVHTVVKRVWEAYEAEK